MAESTIPFSFDALLPSIAQLGVMGKIRLREFLDNAIAQEDLDEDAIEALEDAEEIADAKAAIAEPGFLSLAEFKRELRVL
jgi:predicted PilT family ATPase